MLVHARKYRTEDKLKIKTTETKPTQKKQTTQNTAKQNYLVSRLLRHSARKRGGLQRCRAHTPGNAWERDVSKIWVLMLQTCHIPQFTL